MSTNTLINDLSFILLFDYAYGADASYDVVSAERAELDCIIVVLFYLHAHSKRFANERQTHTHEICVLLL